VKIVTAFVPLDPPPIHFKPEQYHAYAASMANAAGKERFRAFNPFLLEECWLYKWLEERNWLDLPPATSPAADRYPTPKHFVLSNIVQHSRCQWLSLAADEDPQCDVLVWMDYAIRKQGHSWDGHPGVEEHHITEFLEKIENSTFQDIPFAGIWDKTPIDPHGDHWRFVGSLHVIPRHWLAYVRWFYEHECRRWIEIYKTVPLDLPIWAILESNTSLPFRWYAANHDATQLTHFPG